MINLTIAQLALLTNKSEADVQAIVGTSTVQEFPVADVRNKVNLVEARSRELSRYLGTRAIIKSNDPEFVALVQSLQEAVARL